MIVFFLMNLFRITFLLLSILTLNLRLWLLIASFETFDRSYNIRNEDFIRFVFFGHCTLLRYAVTIFFIFPELSEVLR